MKFIKTAVKNEYYFGLFYNAAHRFMELYLDYKIYYGTCHKLNKMYCAEMIKLLK